MAGRPHHRGRHAAVAARRVAAGRNAGLSLRPRAHRRDHETGQADVQRPLDGHRAVLLHPQQHRAAAALDGVNEADGVQHAARTVLQIDQHAVEAGLGDDLRRDRIEHLQETAVGRLARLQARLEGFPHLGLPSP